MKLQNLQKHLHHQRHQNVVGCNYEIEGTREKEYINLYFLC